MIRRLVTLLGVLSFSFFVACGGNDNSNLPKALASQIGPNTAAGIQNGANNMVEKCSGGLQGPSLLLATGLMSSGGAGNIGSLLPLLGGAGKDCEDGILQFFLLANTAKKADGSSAANDPEMDAYKRDQLKRIANKLWAGILLDFQARGIPLTQAQALGLQQQLLGGGPLIVNSLIAKSGSNAGGLGSIAAGLGY